MDTSVITRYRVKKYLKIFSLVLLFALIGLLIYGYVRILPKDIKYSNVSSSSFTVSWTTKTPTKGAVRVIESNNNLPIAFNIFEKEIFNDTRDVRMSELISAQETEENIWESNSFGVKVSDFVTERVVTERGTYYTHHIEVKGLDQEHEYSVMVGDGLLFLNSKNFSDAKSVMTTTIPEAMDTPLPAYGQIKDAQNQDIPIDELKPVTDGVVYFNYLDESTQERSNVFSSSLNDSGGWYIDIATAVDKDGEYFFEKYSQTITNIYGELLIDLGPLGTWKKVIDMNESSPVETIVINIPGFIENPEDPEILIRVEDKNAIENEVVKGVSADGCEFVAFCGGCVKKVDGVQKECACDTETLERRGCGSGNSLEKGIQELRKANANECSGGGIDGSTVKYGTDCKICQAYGDSGTYRWVSAPNQSLCSAEEYVGGRIIAPVQEAGPETPVPCTTTSTLILSKSEDGVDCCIDGIEGEVVANKCVIGYIEKNGKKDNMIITDKDRKCIDPDGCICIYNKGLNSQYTVERDINGECKALVVAPGGNSEGGTNGSCELEGQSCNDTSIGVLYGTFNENCECIKHESPVSPKKGQTCPNPEKNISYGIYNSEGVCVRRTTESLITSEISGDACELPNYYSRLYIVTRAGLIYECKDSKFELNVSPDKIFKEDTNCEEGTSCSVSSNHNCINSEGVSVSCVKGKWSTEGNNEIMLVGFEPIEKGEQCLEEWCRCNGNDLSRNQYCLEIKDCSKSGIFNDPEGKVCDIDTGKTCIYNKGWKCEGNPSENSSLPLLSPSSLSKVFAQENLESEYIIDQTTGKVLNIEPGLYTLEDEESSYMFFVGIQDVKDGKGDVLVYIDTNENGVRDEGEKTLSDFSSTVKINTVSKIYQYELEEGFNFITLPFLVENETARTAAGLLKMINTKYFDVIYSISKYDGKWSVVGQNVELYDNNDFQLVPGQGYIIKANTDITISIVGKPVKFDSDTDNAPITFYPGWNLIGVYGSEVKQYTAKSLIQSINKYESVDFTANNVSRWESDVQRYDGFQLSNENGIDIEYGFDFPINTLQSYFVRILQGKGNWQPELK